MKKDILYVIFAVEGNFISMEDVANIGAGWAENPSRSLLNRLSEHIGPSEMRLLHTLVKESLDENSGNIDKSIQSSNRTDVLKTLGGSVGNDASREENFSAYSISREETGRYTFVEEKGRGGSGRVFISFDEHVGRKIAVKELLPEFGSKENEDSAKETPPFSKSDRFKRIRRRFIKEARVTGQLEHPSIVPVYEIGKREDESLYYTMKYVKGETLCEEIKKAVLPEDRLALLPHFRDMCNAIAYAHSKQVIHRDIKTENVMIGEFGETIVLDWGLSKVKGTPDESGKKLEKGLAMLKQSDASRTIAGHILGTPSYMPPEQAAGEISLIDEKSDTYSLGAVLYEILTGRPPFDGNNALDIMNKVLYKRFVPVKKINPEIPSELAAIAEKALSKSKKIRYSSALEFAEEINSYMAGKRVTAHSYSSGELIGKFVRQNKALSFVMIIAFLTIMISSVASYIKYREAETARKYNLSIVLNSTAEKLEKEKKYNTFAIYAAAAYHNNPANIHSPEYSRDFAESMPGSIDLMVDVTSKLFRDMIYPSAYLKKNFRTDSTGWTVAFSPEGNMVASAGWSINKAGILIMDSNSGEILKKIENPGAAVSDMVFSADGTELYTADWNGVIISSDVKTAEQTFRIDTGEGKIYSISLSPCGDYLLAGNMQGHISLWNLKTEKRKFSFNAHRNGVLSVAFSSDGRKIASGGWDKKLKLWNINGQLIYSHGEHRDGITAVAFSPDDSIVASGGYDKKVILHYLNEKKSFELKGHKHSITGLSFSPDGKQLASSSDDRTVRLWDIGNKKHLFSIEGHSASITDVSFSPDGKTIATGSDDKTLKIWAPDFKNRVEILSEHNEKIQTLSFIKKSGKIVSGGWDRELRLRHTSGKGSQRKISFSCGNIIHTVATDKKERYIALGEDKGNIKILDAETLTLKHSLRVHGDVISSADFSPDGTKLAVGGDDRTITVVSVAEGTIIKEFRAHNDMITAVDFSPDGNTLASSGYDYSVKFWNTESWKENREALEHKEFITDISFSPDGKELAVSQKNGAVVIWKLKNSEKRAVLKGHEQGVNSVSISPDSKFIATSSDDGSVLLWSFEKAGQLIAIHKGEGSDIDFSPDSSSLAVADRTEIHIYPLDFSFMKKNSGKILSEAEQRTGMELNGFVLTPSKTEE
ncbi:MAG: serine/threonine-protein kinase [bacterium]